jgi:cytochrome c553
MLPMFYSLPTFADADSDKMAQTLCAGCHGPTGISTNPLWPNLAGQKDQYSAKQMRAYRDGTRTDPNMSALMQGLSNEDISELAAYYAKLPDGS